MFNIKNVGVVLAAAILALATNSIGNAATLKGQVEGTNGESFASIRLDISVRHKSFGSVSNTSTMNGQFIVEDIPPGECEVLVRKGLFPIKDPLGPVIYERTIIFGSPDEVMIIKFPGGEVKPEKPPDEATLMRRDKARAFTMLLIEAARNGNIDSAQRVVDSGVLDINEELVPGKGYTALHIAAASRQLAMVQFLLSKGAAVNCRTTGGGLSPLHLAVAKYDTAMVDFLLKSGADKSLKDSDGHSASDLANMLGQKNITILFR